MNFLTEEHSRKSTKLETEREKEEKIKIKKVFCNFDHFVMGRIGRYELKYLIFSCLRY